jgi:hypothetical protein
MRKQIKMPNLIENKTVIRYEDNDYLYHCALATETGHIKYIVSALNGNRVRIIHNRDRNKVTLKYHMN